MIPLPPLSSLAVLATDHGRFPAKPCPSPGVIDLVMIEVQSGAYLGEDGIVRFTDIYGRAPAAAIG
ncbi:hypothetical protein PssiTeo3_07470 [Pseudomonas sichuanensis]|nr:hypothetical protein [Pseudomonas sichuanensis]